MTKQVEVISTRATVEEAARKMASTGVGMLPVVDENTLRGILTDRDIAIRIAGEGKSARDVKVQSVMTPGAAYCFDDQDVRIAAAMMQGEQIRRVVVFDRKGQLAGILSASDLALRDETAALATEVIRRVCHPVKHPRRKSR